MIAIRETGVEPQEDILKTDGDYYLSGTETQCEIYVLAIIGGEIPPTIILNLL
jgi:hypothetical protein